MLEQLLTSHDVVDLTGDETLMDKLFRGVIPRRNIGKPYATTRYELAMWLKSEDREIKFDYDPTITIADILNIKETARFLNVNNNTARNLLRKYIPSKRFGFNLGTLKPILDKWRSQASWKTRQEKMAVGG